MSEENLGIKETKEVIAAMTEAGVFVAKVIKDGNINVSDLQYLPELGLKFSVFTEGVKDVDKALAELKDLKQEELFEIISEFYKGVQKFEEAKK